MSDDWIQSGSSAEDVGALIKWCREELGLHDLAALSKNIKSHEKTIEKAEEGATQHGWSVLKAIERKYGIKVTILVEKT